MLPVIPSTRKHESFAVRLIRAQNLRKMRNINLAKAADVSPDLITHMRQGSNPSYKSLKAVAVALNVSVDWLMGLTDEFRNLKGELE